MTRYELPEKRKPPAWWRLVLPTLVLLAAVYGVIFGIVYAIGVTVNFVAVLIEAVP